jgi:hypothetical protein
MTDPSPVGKMFDSIIGITAPTLGLITSMQEQLEYGLRVASLVVGLIVGLLAVWRHFK